MNVRSIGLLAVGVAAGWGGAMLMLGGRPESPPPPLHLAIDPAEPARVAVDTAVSTQASTAGTSPGLQDRDLPSPVAQSRSIPSSDELRDHAASIQDRVLMGAGFTKDRIDWIRQMNADLSAKAWSDLRERRPGFSPESVLDRDWGLWEEMPEEEFVRYRQALGRPTSALIKAITPGSAAEMAGLQPGDEIVGYRGKRVFSIHQLRALEGTGAPDGQAQVDVRRNGQTFQIWTQGGALEFEGESAVDAAQNEMTAILMGSRANPAPK